MPKSRKRKGARRYKPDPDFKRKMNPCERAKLLSKRLEDAGAKYFTMVQNVDPDSPEDQARVPEIKAAKAELDAAMAESDEFAQQPLCRMWGPSVHLDRHT